MRPLLLAPALTLLACTPQGVARLPPSDSFYFPAGIVYGAGDSGSPEGYLYVNNDNFDRRYDYGSVMAVRLDSLQGLPAFGSTAPGADPVEIPQLNFGPKSQVLIQSLAGEMAAYPLPGTSTLRLFTPSRGEGDYLQVLDANGDALNCTFPGATGQDCSTNGPSLTALQNVGNGLPRAPQPVGVGISRDGLGDVWVTHIQGADSPVGSLKNITAYVVRLNANLPTVDPGNFIELGTGGTSSVAVGSRWAFLTGRYFSPRGYMLRLVDRTGAVPMINPGLENIFAVLEARGIALTSDETRLFIVGRSPDTLLVVDVVGANTSTPSLTIIRAVPLPSGPNELQLIERKAPGRGPLVVIPCSLAGSVVVYDDEVGELVSQIPFVGTQPFGVTMQPESQGTKDGVRLFVTNFGDGKLSVLDLPDLDSPEDLRLVAHLGQAQPCEEGYVNTGSTPTTCIVQTQQ